MKSKRYTFKAGILILSLLVIFTLAGCGSNNTDHDTKYSVAGTVLDGEGNPIAGVSLAIKGSKIKDSSVQVDENGKWSAGDLEGEVTITPAKEDWTFNPSAVTVTEKDAGKKDINFTGQEIIYPDAKTLTPGKDATGVETGANVSVEFNQDITEADLTGITIIDSSANPVSDVTAGLSDRVLTISHADFDLNTTYTVTVPADAVVNNNSVGNKEISWRFTIRGALGPPAINSLTPADNSTDVELTAAVSVEFTQDITEEDLSGISITTDGGSTTVTGVSASLSGRIITIAHDDFDYNKSYTATVPAGAVTNIDGIGNKEIGWSFTTRDTLPAPTYISLAPEENATDVEPEATVLIELSREVIEEDLSGISITTDGGSTTVTGVSASLSGRIITIAHDDFDYNKSYTATVPAGAVTNIDGIGNKEISWSFTTRAEPTYTLTLQASPADGGTVTDNTATGPYKAGESVSVTATANTGYTFVNWTADGSEVSKNVTFDYTMPAADTILTANFDLKKYNITVRAEPTLGGEVSGGTTYYHGTNVTVSALSNSGYVFVNWTEGGNEVSAEAQYTFEALSDRELVANFARAYQVGEIGPAGGRVFYDKGDYSEGWRYLEAAPGSTEWAGKPWGGYNTLVGGTGTGIGTGAANTTAIVAAYGEAEPDDNRSDYAAKLCSDLEQNGYSDWFLPSQEELNLMYENLYLQGLGNFIDGDPYWSSSEESATSALLQFFSTSGTVSSYSKDLTGQNRVRAVRRF